MLKLRFLPLACVIGIIMGLFVSLSNSKNNQDSTSALVGQLFPKFKLSQIEHISLKVLEASEQIMTGDINIIHLWSKYDDISTEQQKSLALLNTLGVNIIGVNIKDNLQANDKNIKKLPYKTTINDKKGKLAVKLGIKDTPATFLTDRKGIIRYQIMNNLSDDPWLEEVETAYKRLILEPPKK